MKIKRIGPIGTIVEIVSELNSALVACEVEYEGTDNETHATTTEKHWRVVPARVLNHGSKGVQEYFNYEVEEKVYLLDGYEVADPDDWEIYQAEAESRGEEFLMRMCYIVGSFYDEDTRPPALYEGVRMIKFPDGGSICYNLEDKSLEIEIKGDVTINGRNIFLNG